MRPPAGRGRTLPGLRRQRAVERLAVQCRQGGTPLHHPGSQRMAVRLSGASPSSQNGVTTCILTTLRLCSGQAWAALPAAVGLWPCAQPCERENLLPSASRHPAARPPLAATRRTSTRWPAAATGGSWRTTPTGIWCCGWEPAGGGDEHRHRRRDALRVWRGRPPCAAHRPRRDHGLSGGHRHYLLGCPPSCADWKSAFLGACGTRRRHHPSHSPAFSLLPPRGRGEEVAAKPPGAGWGPAQAEGPKRTTSVGVG